MKYHKRYKLGFNLIKILNIIKGTIYIINWRLVWKVNGFGESNLKGSIKKCYFIIKICKWNS